MSHDDDPPTPVDGSGAYPILREGAQELADKLLPIGTRTAMLLRQRLLAIAAILRSWTPMDRPTDDDRRRLIDELVAATKEATPLVGGAGVEPATTSTQSSCTTVVRSPEAGSGLRWGQK